MRRSRNAQRIYPTRDEMVMPAAKYSCKRERGGKRCLYREIGGRKPGWKRRWVCGLASCIGMTN
jgi:hypothetical protein